MNSLQDAIDELNYLHVLSSKPTPDVTEEDRRIWGDHPLVQAGLWASPASGMPAPAGAVLAWLRGGR
jgi:hypothetical protein